MKIAFINPPLSLLRHEKGLSPDPWFPLGLGYMAACLREAGHEVRLFDPDAAKMPLDELWAQLSDFHPDVVGFTSTTVAFMVAKRLISEAKRRFNCLVLIGGPHVSALPRSTVLGTPGLDAVIRGEGEIPMLALAAEFDARGKVDFNRVPGAAFLENGIYRETPFPELSPDLDLLPHPARDLLDMRPYERSRNPYGKGKMATIISSRGCPSQCNFCANSQSMGRKFRVRKPEEVVAEMEQLKARYGVKHFYIADDCFSIDHDRAVKICDLMIEKNLRVTWQAAGRVNTLLDDYLIEKMSRAGCVEVLLGIETGSERILNLMRKGTTLGMARECCAKLHKYGISCYNSFILGAEGETFSTMLATFFFAKRLAGMLAVFNILVPFPGTPVFEKYYKDFDRPDTDWTDWASLFHKRPYPPRHTALPWWVQKGFMWAASLLYYLDPFQMARMILKMI